MAGVGREGGLPPPDELTVNIGPVHAQVIGGKRLIHAVKVHVILKVQHEIHGLN